jgi:hypothetical protein
MMIKNQISPSSEVRQKRGLRQAEFTFVLGKGVNLNALWNFEATSL